MMLLVAPGRVSVGPGARTWGVLNWGYPRVQCNKIISLWF
ncbi:hypothetical protein RHCRD62_100014 [Rhodococcus sp. RD6.2]|nr:hypothetical protein RHCRD62_100014 [Rhodococcus sp. RD6.2]